LKLSYNVKNRIQSIKTHSQSIIVLQVISSIVSSINWN